MSDPTAPGFESRHAHWLGLSEAIHRILGSARPLEAHEVPVASALGAALSESLIAEVTLPPWDNSAMDGYAVRAEDLRGASPEGPVTLNVSGAVHAGEPASEPVGPGEAIRIMTGAPVPPGADSVVRVEDTDREAEPGRIVVFADRDVGRNIRPGGEDLQAGDTVVEKGQAVTPGMVAALASLGRMTAPVHRAASVAILPTGDELRSPEGYDDVRAGRAIPESNSPMLAAAVAAIGGSPLPLSIAPDDPDILRQHIEDAAEADVLITIGGASMGEADLVKRVLDSMGFEVDFWRVRIRPGSPFSFGWLPRGDRMQPVFGLPGNPTSAFVTFELFVRPFLLALAGHAHRQRRVLRATAGERLSGPAELTYLLRCRLEQAPEGPRVRLSGPQGSGLVHPLVGAAALAIVPEAKAHIEPGEPVDVILLDDAPGFEAPEVE